MVLKIWARLERSDMTHNCLFFESYYSLKPCESLRRISVLWVLLSLLACADRNAHALLDHVALNTPFSARSGLKASYAYVFTFRILNLGTCCDCIRLICFHSARPPPSAEIVSNSVFLLDQSVCHKASAAHSVRSPRIKGTQPGYIESFYTYTLADCAFPFVVPFFEIRPTYLTATPFSWLN